jgi:hypothetical protein
MLRGGLSSLGCPAFSLVDSRYQSADRVMSTSPANNFHIDFAKTYFAYTHKRFKAGFYIAPDGLFVGAFMLDK